MNIAYYLIDIIWEILYGAVIVKGRTMLPFEGIGWLPANWTYQLQRTADPFQAKCSTIASQNIASDRNWLPGVTTDDNHLNSCKQWTPVITRQLRYPVWAPRVSIHLLPDITLDSKDAAQQCQGSSTSLPSLSSDFFWPFQVHSLYLRIWPTKVAKETKVLHACWFLAQSCKSWAHTRADRFGTWLATFTVYSIANTPASKLFCLNPRAPCGMQRVGMGQG